MKVAVLAACMACTSAAYAEGLVLVMDGGSGKLLRSSSASGFARHFGPGGVPLAVDPPAEVPEAAARSEDELRLAARPRAIPSEAVHRAIIDVGTRYAGHIALRAAGITASEWLALFRANIEIESGYQSSAVSPVGAIGLGQLMPGTAAMLGVNPNDMEQNLDGSARYLLMLLERFGSMDLALAGYNAGPEAVEKYGGIPPYAETQGHVRKVMAVFRRVTTELPPVKE